MNGPEFLAHLSEMLGTPVRDDEDFRREVPTVMERIQTLQKMVPTVLDMSEFPAKTRVIFRRIRLRDGDRTHSLLVDVWVGPNRYTAALQKRLSLGIRDPDKWVQDLREAIHIALKRPEVKYRLTTNIQDDPDNFIRVKRLNGSVVVYYDDQDEKLILTAEGDTDEVWTLLEEVKFECYGGEHPKIRQEREVTF